MRKVIDMEYFDADIKAFDIEESGEFKLPKDSDFIKAILTKRYWWDIHDDDKYKKYHPFLVTRKIAFMNTKNLLICNDLRYIPRSDKMMHFHFLFHAIPKQK